MLQSKTKQNQLSKSVYCRREWTKNEELEGWTGRNQYGEYKRR
jgi:hypothetical protein